MESSDADSLAELLCDDATLEMAPSRTWFSGKATCVPYITAHAMVIEGRLAHAAHLREHPA